mmetsp:Transcript_58162/g.103785  ORF Transcript_58162/g.103785 Transcript_58162/m.103785 type:complete len:235 (-) Transcript_58162:410-1114(-)
MLLLCLHAFQTLRRYVVSLRAMFKHHETFQEFAISYTLATSKDLLLMLLSGFRHQAPLLVLDPRQVVQQLFVGLEGVTAIGVLQVPTGSVLLLVRPDCCFQFCVDAGVFLQGLQFLEHRLVTITWPFDGRAELPTEPGSAILGRSLGLVQLGLQCTEALLFFPAFSFLQGLEIGCGETYVIAQRSADDATGRLRLGHWGQRCPLALVTGTVCNHLSCLDCMRRSTESPIRSSIL